MEDLEEAIRELLAGRTKEKKEREEEEARQGVKGGEHGSETQGVAHSPSALCGSVRWPIVPRISRGRQSISYLLP